MDIVAPSSADEMTSIWLRADLDSSESKSTTVQEALSTRGVGEEVLYPARDDEADSVGSPTLRQSILTSCHGATVRGLRLEEIEWSWAELQDDDPLSLMNYCDFHAWTHGSLLPSDAIEGFARNRPLDAITARIASGDPLPPCICVATNVSGPAVLLDGNGRAIAFAALGRRPKRIVLGLSPGVTNWYFYPVKQ